MEPSLTQLVAANDNSPRSGIPAGFYRSTLCPGMVFRKSHTTSAAPVENCHPDRFANLADRRAWLATLPEKHSQVLAWPTAERLSRLESPDAAKILYSYAELMSPPDMVVANDNDQDVAAPESDPDMRHEVRPTEGEMMRAASDGLRCSVVSSKVKGQWAVTDRRSRTYGFSAEGFRIGDLLFRNGALVSTGVTAQGKRKTPTERTRQPKGYKPPPPRSVESIRFLLPANDSTPIAKGACWLGGVTRSKGNTTRPDIGDHEASIEMDRNARRNAVRLALGLDAAVLDAAITDATAAQIGEAFGYLGKTAERQGIRKINEAIEKLKKIAA